MATRKNHPHRKEQRRAAAAAREAQNPKRVLPPARTLTQVQGHTHKAVVTFNGKVVGGKLVTPKSHSRDDRFDIDGDFEL